MYLTRFGKDFRTWLGHRLGQEPLHQRDDLVADTSELHLYPSAGFIGVQMLMRQPIKTTRLWIRRRSAGQRLWAALRDRGRCGIGFFVKLLGNQRHTCCSGLGGTFCFECEKRSLNEGITATCHGDRYKDG
jgi:hypothetical protein